MVSQQFTDPNTATSAYFSIPTASNAAPTRSSQKNFLDPTSGSFVASSTLDMNGAVRPSRHNSDDENRLVPGRLGYGGNDSGLALQSGRPSLSTVSGYNSSADSRSGSLPPSRNDTDDSSRQQYQRFNTTSQRAHLSANAPSYMSQMGPSGQRNAEQHNQAHLNNFTESFGKITLAKEHQNQSYGGQKEFLYGNHTPSMNGYAKEVPSDANDAWSREEMNLMNQESFSQSGSGTGSLVSNPNNHRAMTFGARYSHSPTSSEPRYSHTSPFYSAAGTPPTFQPRALSRAPSRGSYIAGAPAGQAAMLDRKLRGLQQEQQQAFALPPNPLQFRTQFQHPNPYDFHAQQALRMPMNPYYLTPPSNVVTTPQAPRSYSREHDPGQPIRSALLEEFRNNSKTNKRYELKVGSIIDIGMGVRLLIAFRTSTITSLNLVAINMALVSSSRNLRLRIATRRIKFSENSTLMRFN